MGGAATRNVASLTVRELKFRTLLFGAPVQLHRDAVIVAAIACIPLDEGLGLQLDSRDQKLLSTIP